MHPKLETVLVSRSTNNEIFYYTAKFWHIWLSIGIFYAEESKQKLT